MFLLCLQVCVSWSRSRATVASLWSSGTMTPRSRFATASGTRVRGATGTASRPRKNARTRAITTTHTPQVSNGCYQCRHMFINYEHRQIFLFSTDIVHTLQEESTISFIMSMFSLLWEKHWLFWQFHIIIVAV